MTHCLIDTSTALYCVLGRPVAHSKSPAVHNRAFREEKINAVYLAFEPENIEKAVMSIKTLSIRGASVTIPFKESVMAYLDWIDPLGLEIGAVNTIVNEDGVLKGYNTDCRAAIDPILGLGSIRDKRVCIVGAGGAARAVAHGAAKEGAKIIVTNRTQEKGLDLADRVSGEFVPAKEAEDIQADVVINTTSLGMVPNDQVLSFSEKALRPGMLVMDVVYAPMDTCLLKTARSKGCTTIDGLTMFLAQAAAQFTLWTGRIPDIELMRKDILG
ncbi:MAG: shikimate dehydrogenase [Desulfobacter sp.]|nr:MAG: shikimate dehydrogenase [Desulfobacter sp.]